MTVSITTEPTYLIPGKPAQITATASTGNWVDVVLTSAPTASKWAKRLVDEERSEIQLWSSQEGIKQEFTFDVAGRYVCSLREITKGGVTFHGGYSNDPEGYRSETIVGTTSYSFVVGQKMTASISVGRESGSLSLYVWDSTIQPTTVPEHGEKTPRIDANTEKMKVAIATSGVVNALAALEGVAASTAASSFATVVNNIITKFNSHISGTSYHSTADTHNSVAGDFVGAGNTIGLTETLTQVATKMRNHMLNDAGTGYGIGSAAFHSAGDWNNLPAVTGASDTLTTGIMLASLWSSYEAHRVSSVHVAGDTTNTCSGLPALLSVYRNVIAVVTAENPTAPDTDNPGATTLVNRAGMTKA
jgi:hypothetical protein